LYHARPKGKGEERTVDSLFRIRRHIEGDDKRRARLNLIGHLLSVGPYERLEAEELS
jgi:hypothetical protein